MKTLIQFFEAAVMDEKPDTWELDMTTFRMREDNDGYNITIAGSFKGPNNTSKFVETKVSNPTPLDQQMKIDDETKRVYAQKLKKYFKNKFID